jgi:hypothetical protein
VPSLAPQDVARVRSSYFHYERAYMGLSPPLTCVGLVRCVTAAVWCDFLVFPRITPSNALLESSKKSLTAESWFYDVFAAYPDLQHVVVCTQRLGRSHPAAASKCLSMCLLLHGLLLVCAAQSDVLSPSTAGDRASSQPVQLDRLCPVGTAARVLQLSRLVQVRQGAAWLCIDISCLRKM